MAFQTLFPTIISVSRHPASQMNFLKQLADECALFREEDSRGRAWSKKNYPNGYTSYASITDVHKRSSRFGRLESWISRHVKRYADRLDMDLRGGRLEPTAFWINMMSAGSTHALHLHPLSVISGTFFLQSSKGASPFKIEDPRLSCFMASPPRKPGARMQNRQYIEVPSDPGTLVLFESWLKHEVPMHRAKAERISVSFNYDWVDS